MKFFFFFSFYMDRISIIMYRFSHICWSTLTTLLLLFSKQEQSTPCSWCCFTAVLQKATKHSLESCCCCTGRTNCQLPSAAGQERTIHSSVAATMQAEIMLQAETIHIINNSCFCRTKSRTIHSLCPLCLASRGNAFPAVLAVRAVLLARKINVK
jgi:hypothetical protein